MRIFSAGLFVVLAALMGCNGGDTVPDSPSQAFATIERDAVANGGAAMRVTPGKAAKLEVFSYDSPIYGAAVSLPASAVVGTKDPVLVIQFPKGYSASGTDDTQAGPPVEIKLFELGSREPIKLGSAAQVALPFTATSEPDIYNLHVGRFDERKETWSYSTTERVENNRARVKGKTLTFGRFVALQSTQPIADGTFFFRMVDKGVEICQVSLPVPVEANGSGSRLDVFAADSDGVLIKAASGRDGSYFFSSNVRTNRLVPPDSGAVRISEDFGEDSKLLVQCGDALKVYSEKIANQSIRQQIFSDWLPSRTYEAFTCQYLANRVCKKQEGVLHVRSRYAFTDDANPNLKAYVTLDFDVSYFSWDKLQ